MIMARFSSPEEKVLEIRYAGLSLEVAVNSRTGRKGALFFIHGLGCSKDSFKNVWNFPELEQFSVVTCDLVGFGDSSHSKGFSYSMEEHAEICRIIIEELNLDRIHVVGHSMGGVIGLLLIEKIPEKVATFVNVEGNLIGEDCELSRRAVSVPYSTFEESLFDQIKQEMTESGDENVLLWYQWLCRGNSRGFYYSAKSLVEWSDSRIMLSKFLNLKTRKAYMYGDKNSGIKILTVIRDKIRTIPISESGHFMMVENPHEFYQKLGGIIRD